MADQLEFDSKICYHHEHFYILNNNCFNAKNYKCSNPFEAHDSNRLGNKKVTQIRPIIFKLLFLLFNFHEKVQKRLRNSNPKYWLPNTNLSLAWNCVLCTIWRQMSWFLDSKLVHFAVTHFRYIERATWVNSIESYDHSYQLLASILFIFFQFAERTK